MKKIIPLFILLIFSLKIFSQTENNITSPNGLISVKFEMGSGGEAIYSVYYSGQVILEQSKLGIIRADADFSRNLSLNSVSPVEKVTDNYTMLHGKRRNCTYNANKRVFHLSRSNGDQIDIIFQLSDDGVAFRYYFPGQSNTVRKITTEVSSFNFLSSARAYVQPCMDSKTGWNNTQPSYEEHYERNIPVGTAAPYNAGWVMPALFSSGNFWISITETAVDGNYCGSRLSRYSPNGEYSIQFPQSTEGIGSQAVFPESVLPWYTPWRIIALANNLGTLIESTLGTDLAIPAKYDVSSWLKPGIASWSWIMFKDGSINYDTQKQYIDFAASMNWRYCLIDVNWDATIGYNGIADLAAYAATKNVKLILWYNSAGDWNTVTFYTPRNKLLTRQSRTEEFQRLKNMGIAGIKVDFFPGDGQSAMQYYTDILQDAATYNISVNFHGSTYPRGWARTYPNLVSMEAIKGEEFITFNQSDADAQPTHCTTIPFTRNLFDPMDFTPVNFSGIPGIAKRTTKGFEMALSVIFLSGIQHIAESNTGMSNQQNFIQEYMRNIPGSWDDVKFIDGYPGRYVIIARKSGENWYIAGINGENANRTVSLQLPFISSTTQGQLITDSPNSTLMTTSSVNFAVPLNVTMYPNGGFVIKTSSGTCTPTAITPYVQINNGSWAQTASANVSVGNSAKFGPQPINGGSWSWSGPLGFSASTREVTISNVQTNQAGTYVATYTNTCGASTTQNFTITVNGSSGLTNIALTATASTSYVSPWETLSAVNDNSNPANSNDKSNGAYGNWDNPNSIQWVQYDWASSYKISKVEVYWFDDAGGVLTPTTAYIENWNGSAWVNVGNVPLVKDAFNVLNISNLTSSRLRVSMKNPSQSTGILEWRVWGVPSSGARMSPVETSGSKPYKIYPNPVSDVLNIELKHSGRSKVAIYNSDGKLIYENNFIDKIKINKTEIGNSGIYFVKLPIANKTYTEKIFIK